MRRSVIVRNSRKSGLDAVLVACRGGAATPVQSVALTTANKSAGEEPRVEEGVLYQPLGVEEGGVQAVPLCDEGATGACAKNVLSIREVLGSAQQDAEAVGRWEKGVIHSVIRHIASALGYRNFTGHDAACIAFGAGVNFVLKDSPFAVTNAAGVAAGLGCAALFNN